MYATIDILELKIMERWRGEEDGSELYQLPGAVVAEVDVLCEKAFSLFFF